MTVYGQEYGEIIGTKRMNEIGMVERIDWEWQGKPTAQISMGLYYDFCPKEPVVGDVFKIGIFKVKIIEDKALFFYDRFTVVRMDYPFWWAIYFWHRFNVLFDIFYRRLIITCAVWGLADYNPAVVPTHVDLRAFQRLKSLYDVLRKNMMRYIGYAGKTRENRSCEGENGGNAA